MSETNFGGPKISPMDWLLVRWKYSTCWLRAWPTSRLPRAW